MAAAAAAAGRRAQPVREDEVELVVSKQELSPCAVEKFSDAYFLNFLNCLAPLGHRGAGPVFQDCESELETSAKTTVIFS